MTVREEQRDACIEAMETAIISAIIDAGGTIDVPMKPVATYALDALHSVAFVNPIEATVEMVQTGQDSGRRRGYSVYADVWRAMSIIGDLTNPGGSE